MRKTGSGVSNPSRAKGSQSFARAFLILRDGRGGLLLALSFPYGLRRCHRLGGYLEHSFSDGSALVRAIHLALDTSIVTLLF